MSETCAVCHKGKGPEKCEVCGFSDNGVIYRSFPIPEDTQNWLDTVVKPYRIQWEAKKREEELLTQLEEAKKREAELLAQVEEAKSNQRNFAPATFTDPRDGKVYRTVKIGKQVWMAQNLNFESKGFFAKRYGKCYNNTTKNAEKYGRLYNWETALKVCPVGWHLPTKAEWDELIAAVGGIETAGKHLKAKSGWNAYLSNPEYYRAKINSGLKPDPDQFIRRLNFDTYGFSALPGGCGGSDGGFDIAGYEGYWWSSSDCNSNHAHLMSMNFDSEGARWYHGDKSYLHSVRCLQDY